MLSIELQQLTSNTYLLLLYFQFKANHNKKGPYEFGQLKHVQDLGDHSVSLSRYSLFLTPLAERPASFCHGIVP